VANTEGDFAKALRYSRQSLEEAFDNASYLDTLAHCHAAAGELERAVRVQALAVRHEPHSLLVRRNEARFRARLKGAPAP
jgi:Flp pilus assembly protein TadD